MDFTCLLVGCLTSQNCARVSQGRICLDNFACFHTEIEVEDQTSFLKQSQYTDTGRTSTRLQAPVKLATGVPSVKSLVQL